MKFPMGNAGNATPGRAPMVQIADTSRTAQAVTRLADVGVNAGLNATADATRAAQDEARRQAAVAEAAARAKESLTLQETDDRLRDLHDEVATGVLQGTVPKAEAEKVWQERSKKTIDEALPGFREETRGLVTPRLEGMAARLGNGVRRTVEKRDRQDITADLTTSLEKLQREYRLDPEKSTAQMNTLLDTLGPFSNLTPEQIAKARTGWVENSQYTLAYEAVSAGRADPKALKGAETLIGKLDGIDPQKRAVLLDRVQGYRMHQEQQAELGAARAARESERLMQKAQAEFQVFQGLADKGTVMSPEYIDRAIAATAGTPYANGIRALAQQAKEAGGIAAQPVAVQRATLDAIDAQIATAGRSPELDKRREQVQKVLSGTEGDIKRDPLRAGLERGVITKLTPLDMSAGIPGIVQQLTERTVQADRVRQWAGTSVSPLTADEAAQVGRTLATLAPEQRANAVAMISSAMPPAQGQALAQQIDQHDRPLALALAVGTQQTTQGRTTAELILRGAQAVKDKSVKEEKGAEFGVRAQIAKEVGEVVGGQAREDVIDAARLIYLGKQAAGESVSERSAVNLALGGPIVEHNGRRVPVPAGLDADTLRKKLQTLAPDKINAQQVMAGGRSMTVPEFMAVLPDAQLEPAGLGRYVVRAGGALVLNEQRRPVVVDVR